MSPTGSQFGGSWTEQKLDVLAHYLERYQQALKDQPFRCAYIDAFAGSGSRVAAAEAGGGRLHQGFFGEFAGQEPQALRAGSTRRALEIHRPFDRYLFIERDQEKCQELETLRDEYPSLATRIEVISGDANAELQALCSRDWAGRRAVLFLDPYGMQVDWITIEAIAGTKAIDMWLLFPLGIGVNRMLPADGELPPGWRSKLDAFLGTTDWYDAFYRPVSAQQTLFGDDEIVKVKASYDAIGDFFVKRLEAVFPHVSQCPGILMNSTKCPLYLLCFAAANEKGGPIAVRIADHLLKKIT